MNDPTKGCCKPDIGNIFQHRYGGIYIVKAIGKYTDKPGDAVVYKHLWPFEESIWIRPVEEWTCERFRPISHMEATIIMEGDAAAAREATTKKKQARKA